MEYELGLMFGHLRLRNSFSIVVVPDPAFDPLVKPAFEDLDLRIGGISISSVDSDSSGTSEVIIVKKKSE